MHARERKAQNGNWDGLEAKWTRRRRLIAKRRGN